MAKTKKKVGKLSIADMRSLINKKAGMSVAHNLNEDSPTIVKDWISTGSRWLDSIICRGKLTGIPVGKITEIAGLESTGKSYMAAQVAANAQKMGLTVPIANSQSVFLVLNQLKTNISRSPSETLTTPYMTPGGKAMIYAYSLRVWLTGRKAKASFVLDDKGFRIGSEVKVKLEKSRFGTQGRQCNFKILWGDEVGVQDEESWLDAIKGSQYLSNSGAWFTLDFGDNTSDKFQTANWKKKLEEPKFRQRVLDVMDEEIIMKFDKRIGDAAEFYEKEGE
jgi:RecA/RadA recombinase